ncbi:MAG: ChaN family lipoprotein [Syntrophaceae bacterium]|nr:ChaN family lipoprotein [Syntrophaceae bacterium]
MRKIYLWAILLPIVGILSSGCVQKGPFPPWISKISSLQIPIGSEEIFRLPEGNQITFGELLKDLSPSRVIFVGESHDQIEHHQIQLKLIQNLVTKGKNVVIAMEMFERRHQSVLDQWNQGLLTEEKFLREVQWETTWGMDYELYKGILDQAKHSHLKVLGMNLQRDLVRKVAQNGIENLSPEDKNQLPEMDFTNPSHRTYIQSIYKNHHGEMAENFENFYQAQTLWDEGMAETLAEFLKSPDGEGKTVLVLAGSGHIVFGFGIPKRFYRRTSIPYQTIVLKAWKEKLDEDFTFIKTSSPLANFLWVTKPNPPERTRPSIGVILKQREDQKGLWIEKVIPHSLAEKAGLLLGDRLIGVEGKEISKVKDIHDAVVQKGLGKEIVFTIIREGMEKEIKVTFPSSENGLSSLTHPF